MDFVLWTFDADERATIPADDGSIAHGELRVGGSVLMTFDSRPDWPATPSFLMVYVEDCGATHERALRAGGTTVTELATNAWGDRGSRVRDPFGNLWWIQTRVENVSEEDATERLAQEQYLNEMHASATTLDRAMRALGRMDDV